MLLASSLAVCWKMVWNAVSMRSQCKCGVGTVHLIYALTKIKIAFLMHLLL